MTTITLPRATVEQALKTLEAGTDVDPIFVGETEAALRAALAQEQTEPDISRCPQCNGPADNGFDRSFPPSPYLCTKCMAEPVQVAERERVASQWDGCVTHQLDTFGPVDIGASIRAGELVEAQQAEPVGPVAWRTFDGEGGYDYRTYADNENYAAEWAQRNPRHVGWVEPLYTAPPQRKLVPLTEEVAALIAQRDALLEALKAMLENSADYTATRDQARAAIKAVKEGK